MDWEKPSPELIRILEGASEPMKEYVQMPQAIWSDEAAMDEWMRRSVEFASTMPPKQPKPPKPKGSRS